MMRAAAGPRYDTTGRMPEPQRVLQHHDALAQPLGARGADEVLAQHLEHAGAREPRDVGDVGHRQRQHRQHAARRAAPQRGRQPVQPEREHQHEQRARARSWAPRRRPARAPWPRGPPRGSGAPPRARRAGMPTQHRQQQRPAAQFGRDANAVADDLAHLALRVLVRRPEVAVRARSHRKRPYCSAQRPVEAVDGACSCALRRRGDLLLGLERPARREAHEKERERGDHPQRGHDQQQPAQDERGHRALPRPAMGSCWRQSWSIHTCVSGWMSSAVG